MVRKPKKKIKLAKLKTVDPPGSIKNKKFLQAFHDDVIKSGRGGEDAKTGKPTTMKLASVGVGKKTYVLPLHNPATRKTGTAKEAAKRFQKAINSGELTGFKSVAEAEDDLRVTRKKIIKKR